MKNVINTCSGKSDGSVAVAVAGGSPDYTYSWSNGVSSITSSLSHLVTSLPSSTYTITVTDANGCSSTTTASVNSFPIPTVNAGNDTTIKTGQTVQLDAKSATAISFLWTSPTYLNYDTIFDPLSTPAKTTTYTVLIKDANNCTATDAVTITITEPPQGCDSSMVFMPTAFSPNGDGQNDVLYLHGPTCITQMRLLIYDRWGELVFTTTSISSGWDGLHRGKPMDTAVFMYYITMELSNGQSLKKKGNVTLVR